MIHPATITDTVNTVYAKQEHLLHIHGSVRLLMCSLLFALFWVCVRSCCCVLYSIVNYNTQHRLAMLQTSIPFRLWESHWRHNSLNGIMLMYDAIVWVYWIANECCCLCCCCCWCWTRAYVYVVPLVKMLNGSAFYIKQFAFSVFRQPSYRMHTYKNTVLPYLSVFHIVIRTFAHQFISLVYLHICIIFIFSLARLSRLYHLYQNLSYHSFWFWRDRTLLRCPWIYCSFELTA